MALETVYAIYTFEAEHDDEVPFKMGEPIAVLEKDDMYRDGWWKGRNIRGQVGLFPKNYTAYEGLNPPSSPLSIQTNLQPITPTSALHMHGSDLDLPSPSFRRPSPSIDETIDDIQDKLQRMGVRTEEEQIYQNKINQQHLWSQKDKYSSKLIIPSSSESSTTSSRMSSVGRQQSSPHSPFDSVGSTKKVEVPSPSTATNGKPTNGHPITWDVDQVCLWLSEKGFESEIHHFIENDITGDVLLELNVATLKELDIISFGKRVRIMNAITDLKSQLSLNGENDDISDLEEYNHTQNTTPYSPVIPQNNVYSNQAANSSGILHQQQYGTTPNPTLPQIDELVAFPKHLTDSPRNSTTNFTRNAPPTYYPRSRRIDDAEGANIETVTPKSSNKKSNKLLAKLSFAKNKERRSLDNSVKRREKPRTVSAGGWEFNRNEEDAAMKDNMMRIKPAGDEAYMSSPEPEKNRPLKFISSKRKNRPVMDRSSLVGSQLGLPRPSTELERRKQMNPNSILYDPRHIDYFFENIDDSEDLNEEALRSIEAPDHEGWLKKQGDKYKTWKSRYCILKGVNFYYFKSDKELDSSKVKGYINLAGYRIISDENILHGKYGFKLIHDTEKSHYFAQEDIEMMKGWMKAMMKSTIARDSKAPVISSSNIATIPLSEARKMTPRPPDPRRPSVSSTALNKVSSPLLRPTSPVSPTLSQRAGSPMPTRPLTPTLQTFQNSSSPRMRPFDNNRLFMIDTEFKGY